MKLISEIEECPYCGHDEWFRKQLIRGEGWHRTRFDGEDADNGDFYEGTTTTDKSKFAFCSKCWRRIGLLDD